ncbi:hypothetical protein ACIQTU_04510 [Brevundimonas sp. NPDC090276]|uniref:hypothetical protein n=1 Tax=Brevundimonas sp. NPDC090276 TaxID=3363956 RepID=UPI00383A8375
MKKEWVQIVVAVAVITTTGAAIVFVERGIDIGTLGEWVSGLGSIGAVAIALWIAESQRKHATQQFSDERDHANKAVEEDRRYQAKLASMSSENEEKQRRESQFRRVNWVASHVGGGIHYAKSMLTEIKNNTVRSEDIAKFALRSRAFSLASQTLSTVGPDTFDDYELSSSANNVVSAWLNISQPFEWYIDNQGVSFDQLEEKFDFVQCKAALVRFTALGLELLPEWTPEEANIRAEKWYDDLMA